MTCDACDSKMVIYPLSSTTLIWKCTQCNFYKRDPKIHQKHKIKLRHWSEYDDEEDEDDEECSGLPAARQRENRFSKLIQEILQARDCYHPIKQER